MSLQNLKFRKVSLERVPSALDVLDLKSLDFRKPLFVVIQVAEMDQFHDVAEVHHV